MKKNEIIKMLKILDSILIEPLEITICGGAAAVLFHGINRATEDIDVLTSIPKLSEIIKSSIAQSKKIADVINDGAKGFENYLDGDYKSRRVLLMEEFKKLKVYSISKVDLFIMKLASRRVTDLNDISKISLTQNDLKILEGAILRISAFDPKAAMNMDNFIKEYKLHGK